MDLDAAVSASRISPLRQHWLAEAVRLREAHWGPLEDQGAVHAALRQSNDLSTRILFRAAWLAAHGTLQARLDQWAQGARWALIALALASALAGTGAASAALSQPGNAINLAMALLGLLGLHALTFLLWGLGCLPGIQAGDGLSRFWLWLTQKIVRGPDAALAAQAFLSLLGRTGTWKPLVGIISHSAWTLAYLCAIPALLVLLSTRSYTFHWETTLLSVDALTVFSHWLGSLPQALGFPMPDQLAIGQSMDSQMASASVQADWSLWLIGCLVCWGLLPRLAGLLICGVWLYRRLQNLAIDPALPGWMELRERLQPRHESLGVDRPATAPGLSRSGKAQPTRSGTHAAVLAYELGPDVPWPPTDLPAHIMDLGRCDSREDRLRIRTQLDAQHLLLVCDGRLTPDRGTMTWLDELSQRCPGLQILCIGGLDGRRQAWHRLLSQHALSQADSLGDWLTHIGNPLHE